MKVGKHDKSLFDEPSKAFLEGHKLFQANVSLRVNFLQFIRFIEVFGKFSHFWIFMDDKIGISIVINESVIFKVCKLFIRSIEKIF